jgi:hypothetical protein
VVILGRFWGDFGAITKILICIVVFLSADSAHADEQDFDFFGGHIQSETDGYVEVK